VGRDLRELQRGSRSQKERGASILADGGTYRLKFLLEGFGIEGGKGVRFCLSQVGRRVRAETREGLGEASR